MKKLVILSTLIIATGAVVSCKSDRTCSCTVSTTGLITSTLSYDTTFVDMSKSDAKAECDKLDTYTSVFGTTVSSECELK